MKKFFRVVTLLFICHLSYSLFGQQDDVLVIVGNDTVTKSEFLATYSKNNSLADATEKDLREYLSLFINFKLKVNEGKALKVDTSANFQRELLSYRNQSAQQYLIDKEVTEALINEAFEHSKYHLRASHILIKCSESPKDTLAAYKKAMQIRNEILNGLDFGDAAVKYSDDPSARDRVSPQNNRFQPGNKGDIGYFTVFNVIYPFETAAYNTPVGTISMPVRSIIGYHLIYVTDKIPAIEKISIAQIFIQDSLAKNGKMLPETKAKLDFIQKKLKKGESFAEMVTQYSDDKSSISKGGVVDPFAPQRRQGDFVKGCISLEIDDYSEPIPTFHGWHIVKLNNIEYIKPSEESKYFLKNKISRDARSFKSQEALIEKLKEEYFYHEKGKKAAFIFLVKNMPVEYFQSTKTNLEDLPGIDDLKPIFTFAGRAVTVKEFAKFISRFQGLTPEKDIVAFLEEKYPDFVTETMLKFENENLEAKYPEFKNLVTEYHEGMILYEINSAEVWMKAVQDTVGLRAYYEEIKNNYPISKQDPTPQAFEDIKATIINEYQNYLEKNWLERLRAKYPVVVDEKVFSSILKK